jgi:hypothetical protein
VTYLPYILYNIVTGVMNKIIRKLMLITDRKNSGRGPRDVYFFSAVATENVWREKAAAAAVFRPSSPRRG